MLFLAFGFVPGGRQGHGALRNTGLALPREGGSGVSLTAAQGAGAGKVSITTLKFFFFEEKTLYALCRNS